MFSNYINLVTINKNEDQNQILTRDSHIYGKNKADVWKFFMEEQFIKCADTFCVIFLI